MALTRETQQLANDLIDFMQKKFEFDRIPHIKYVSDMKNSKKILGMTGGYDPDHEEITIYITNRHPKDVLRSLAHEMMHHVQKCEGDLADHDMSLTRDPNYIMHDEFLKEIEADAFRRGNVTFREWEASKKGGKQMDENKNLEETEIPKKALEKIHAKAKEAVKGGGFKQYGEKALSVAIAKLTNDWKKEHGKKVGKPKEKTPTVKENKEIELNDALKNSHYYVPSDRALADAYNMRDEKIYNELLRKFKIKK